MTADRTAGPPPAERGASDEAEMRRRFAPGRARAGQSRLRRRLFAGVRLLAALTIVGGVYTAFAPGSSAEDAPKLSSEATEGKRLYDISCITCHGTNGQGVQNRGPSLIGVGSASVDFQVSSGRMPAAREEAQIERKDPQFDEKQTRQLAEYIQALGGGPQLPGDTSLYDPSKGDLAKGGALFRVNCSSCHAFSTNGGALSGGKYAPTLEPATPRQMYAAMLTGPQNMPVFNDNNLSPQDKADIITALKQTQQNENVGGFNLGSLGPVAEGLFLWIFGLGAIVAFTVWLTAKAN